MQAETSGTDTAVKLAWADKTEATGWSDSRCGDSGASHCDWDVTGIAAGTYEIQLSVKGNSNSNVEWWSADTAAHSRYYYQAGENTADAPKINYESTGLTSSSAFCLSSVLGQIEIAAGTTTFQMHYDGSGYILYGLEYVRLIKVA